MLLILTDNTDTSTNYVINWLLYLQIPYFRINDTDSIQFNDFLVSNNKVSFSLEVISEESQEKRIIHSKDITAFWYRRGLFRIRMPAVPNNQENDFLKDIVVPKMISYLKQENLKLIDFLYYYLNQEKHIGNFYENSNINKISNLYEAQACGILIPDYAIINKKDSLINFLSIHKQCIFKGINENGFYLKNAFSIGNLTQLISIKDIKNIPDSFNYSCIQQYIDKKADIRVFYLTGQIYSAAIFSQNDKKTKVDFRNYNRTKPNRIVPFKMPKSEEQKLDLLMRKLNYKSGSIDYVLGKNNQLYFLEINPVGQYAFMSSRCNYNIDKVIAEQFDYEERR